MSEFKKLKHHGATVKGEQEKITVLYDALKKHPSSHNSYYSSRQKDNADKRHHTGRHC